MSAIEKTVQTVEKVQKTRRIIALLSLPAVGIIAAVMAVLLLIFFIIFLYFYQLLVFGDPDKIAMENSGSGYVQLGDGQYPGVQLDVDGKKYAWPVPTIARVSSGFGNRNLGGNEFHKGIDIANGAAKTGNQPVYAMAAGTVTHAGSASGYGIAIYIDHGNGLVTKYGHLDSSLNVTAGQVVAKGQLIARIGAGIVGRSTGSHLHFQVEENGSPVNPLKYVQPPGSGEAGGPSTLPGELRYKPMNIPAVMKFLNSRNSALADPAILAMIDRAGQQTNVNPYLLVAIPGQEQSFVPRTNNHASEIIRNPWNVYGCWCKGKGATLTTEQSAVTAAKTIIKLSKGRPANRDPIEWLSTTDNPAGYYAEHGGWWIGVSKYFKILSDLGG
ncbi:peptidoglycan DD-metalloendopeptidase family protein [Paenibacillus sp. NRS-1783]|uniref:M23 family metallopeptidase n=1 Tax=Paenibacillus sp. NRS-1783 TaxID=3233907 RepID=UPI003D2B6BC6